MTSLDPTPPEHEHSAVKEEAARHIADMPEYPRPIVPYLVARYQVTPKDACEIIGIANQMKMLRRAFG